MFAECHKLYACLCIHIILCKRHKETYHKHVDIPHICPTRTEPVSHDMLSFPARTFKVPVTGTSTCFAVALLVTVTLVVPLCTTRCKYTARMYSFLNSARRQVMEVQVRGILRDNRIFNLSLLADLFLEVGQSAVAEPVPNPGTAPNRSLESVS